MPFLAVYPWSLFTTAVSTANQTGNTTGTPFIGQSITFDGGAPVQIEITDDDPDFEDAYVETGALQTLTTGFSADGITYAAGTVVENEFALLDAGGNEIWVLRVDGRNVGIVYPDTAPPSPGDSFLPSTANDGAAASEEPYTLLLCFAQGTHIATPSGNRRVEALAVGDHVSTWDGGFEAIQWHGQFQAQTLAPAARPIYIDLPGARPLILSAQHRVLVETPGGGQALAPAKGLTGLPGITACDPRGPMTFHHLLLRRHAILNAGGIAAESFLPGPMSADTCDQALAARAPAAQPLRPAKPLLTVQDARQLVRQGALRVVTAAMPTACAA